MKKITLLLLGGCLFVPAMAQEEATETYHSDDYQQCDRFFKTVPLRDIVSVDYVEGEKDMTGKDRLSVGDLGELTDIGIPETNGIDPLRQDWMGNRTDVSMKATWNGLTGGTPPDPTGAAGHQYYVQAKNGSYRVYTKDGSNEGGGSLNGIWGETGLGDPIVMYDRYADRWFISQFGQVSDKKIYIAVSETSDPLGAYYTYEFTMPNFPDYPKYGVWHDAYYMTANCNPRNNNCVAFEREKMLVGDATAGKINMTFPSLSAAGFYSIPPAYADGATAPDDDEPCYFISLMDNSWAGTSADGYKIYKCELDWDASSADLSVHQTLDPTSFNSIFNASSFSDLSQKGTTQKLDAVEENIMYRVQYRRFDDYNVMMICHTIDADNTNRAAIRWAELREENDGVWYIYQEGTYDPDDNHRWMGSISMDAQGNIGLAYSFMGDDDYAGLRYTGRFKDDPLGEMTVQEQIAIEGSGSQTTNNRYGDYAQMTMDPSDDMTFWMTGEYLGSGGSVRTRIFSFSSWHLLGEEKVDNSVPLFKAFQPTPGLVRLSWTDIEDDNLHAEFYSSNGQLIFSQELDDNSTQKDIPSSNFAKGIYIVKLIGENTNFTKKLYIGQ